MTCDRYLPIFQIFPDGSLVNIEVGGMSAAEILRNGKVFQGGNWNHLHKLLELRSGQSLLYVGDHMYSDILRSKRTLGWRTLLIVPELQHELRSAKRAAERQVAVARLRGEVSVLDEMLQEDF